MNHPDPKSLWDQLLRAFSSWLDDDDEPGSEEEASEDPSLMFHLMLTAPLVIGFLLIVRRATPL